MTGLIVKLIACPILLVILSYLLPSHISYPNLWTPVIVGALLAVVGFGSEVIFLGPSTIMASTIADFFVTAIVVYFSQWGSGNVTYMGAIIAGILVAVVEYPLHIYLINNGRVNTDPEKAR